MDRAFHVLGLSSQETESVLGLLLKKFTKPTDLLRVTDLDAKETATLNKKVIGTLVEYGILSYAEPFTGTVLKIESTLTYRVLIGEYLRVWAPPAPSGAESPAGSDIPVAPPA